MRRSFFPLLICFGSMFGAACATGVETDVLPEDEDLPTGSGTGGSTPTTGPGSGGAPTTTTAATGGSTTSAGGMSTTTTTTTAVTSTSTSATSAASTTTTTTTAATTTSVTTTTTGGGGNCNPLSPATVCGSGHHCVPTPSGTPICSPPTGLGTQYASCTTSDTCGPIYECVFTGSYNWCMQWCQSDFDCPSVFDYCTPLNPAVFVGTQEWGVCWDGQP